MITLATLQQWLTASAETYRFGLEKCFNAKPLPLNNELID